MRPIWACVELQVHFGREEKSDAQAAEAMVPKIRGTILGIPVIRIIVYCGLYMGVPYFGKLPLLKLDLDLTCETHAETKPSSPNTITRTLFLNRYFIRDRSPIYAQNSKISTKETPWKRI